MLFDEGDANSAWSEAGDWGHNPGPPPDRWWELSDEDIEIIEFACGVDAEGRKTLAEWWTRATADNVVALPTPTTTDHRKAA